MLTTHNLPSNRLLLSLNCPGDFLETDMNAMSEIDPLTVEKRGNVTIYHELTQGSDEWLAARCGLLTASEMKLIMTPTLKVANNEKTRAHLYELLAQRVTQYVEPSYIGDDMLRGQEDEFDAVLIYHEQIAPVSHVGFITNDKLGFTIGYSPDGLVGADGLLECKSRRQKFQAQTIIEHVATGGVSIPTDYILQHQTGLFVSERKWIDFISYCGGMPMVVIRVYPDDVIQNAIAEAAEDFETKLQAAETTYRNTIETAPRLFTTERKNREEIFL